MAPVQCSVWLAGALCLLDNPAGDIMPKRAGDWLPAICYPRRAPEFVNRRSKVRPSIVVAKLDSA